MYYISTKWYFSFRNVLFAPQVLCLKYTFENGSGIDFRGLAALVCCSKIKQEPGAQ